jgi:hypothetical protein
VEVAEASKKREMDRDVRFQDTTTGKVYEKTAGITPFLAAAGLSGLNRAAAGKALGKESVLAPLAVGAGEGVAAANLPLAADAYLVTPPLNPEREAYRTYARDLPKGHPEKEDAAAYAQTLPEENPVRTLAAKQLYDPWKLAERSGIGAIEGVLGQYAGPKVPQLAGRVYEGAKSMLGNWQGRPTVQPPKPTTLSGILREEGRPLQSVTVPAQIADPIPPGSATGRSEMAKMLRDSPSPQRQLPAPGETSNRPAWASDPPENVKLDKGYEWHAEMGRQRSPTTGNLGPAVKYSAPRTKKESGKSQKAADDGPEKPGVQIDDTKPLRYED